MKDYVQCKHTWHIYGLTPLDDPVANQLVAQVCHRCFMRRTRAWAGKPFSIPIVCPFEDSPGWSGDWTYNADDVLYPRIAVYTIETS